MSSWSARRRKVLAAFVKSDANAHSRQRRFQPRLELLEDRRLLAAAVDLAVLQGRVFDDASNNGYTAGEEVAGATLQLYRDNGDGIFQPSGGDSLVGSDTTDANGLYEFSDLTAGGYFVLQPAQPALGLLRSESPLITVSAEAVKGQIRTTIDSFDQTSQEVIDTIQDGVPVTSSVAAPEVIGGERDMYVNKTSVNGAVQLNVDNPLLPDQLTFDSVTTGAGERRITWDGVDGDALNVNDTGLANVDLTANAVGVQLQIRADQAGGNVIVRLYSDDGVAGTATRYSSATLPIPLTQQNFLSAELIRFSDFVATSGGGADFTNVTAIEMEITAGADVNGAAELVGTVGTTVFTQDFANYEEADLSLTKTVDNATPNVSQEVTFTVQVDNAGPDSATGVEVTDAMPTGITFRRFSTASGTYDSATGIWTIGTIASGDSATITITGVVDDAGRKVNTAQVTAANEFDADSSPANNLPGEDDQASVNVDPQTIDLSVAKTIDNARPNIGDNVTFLVTLSNAGPQTATGIAVRDLLPTGLALVLATESAGSYNEGSGVWTLASLESGDDQTLTMIATVQANGSLVNTAEVIAADQFDVDSTPNNADAEEDDQASAGLTTLTADLSLTKTASNLTPNVGDSVTFTLTVSNAGPDAASGVTVTDQLPAGFTLVSVSDADAYDQATGVWTVGNIAVGVPRILVLTATVDSPGTLINSAQVSASQQQDPDSTPNDNLPDDDDQDSVTIDVPAIDLSLTKTVDNPRPNLGDEVVFTIRANNAGPDVATDVIVLDSLPAGYAFAGKSTTSGTYTEANGNWVIPTIAVGETAVLEVRATVVNATPGVNTAEVIAAGQYDTDSSPNNDDSTEDDQASVGLQLATADLSLTKTVSAATPDVGEEVTFTIQVRNSGPDAATNIEIEDILPAGLAFVSDTATLGSYDEVEGIWSLENLPFNGEATLQVVATVEAAGTLVNTAEVVAVDQQDPDSTPNDGNSTDDDFASVDVNGQQIDLSVTKTVSDPLPNVGDSITYLITVRNDGPSTATGVVLLDRLPSGVVLTDQQASAGSYVSNTGLWSVASIEPGNEETLELTVRVDRLLNELVNRVQVQAADQPDLDSVPGDSVVGDDDLAEVSIRTQVADLSLTKTVNESAPNVGDVVRFQIELANDGPDNATSIVVADNLPAGLEYFSHSTSAGDFDPVSGEWTIDLLTDGGKVSLTIDATVVDNQPSTNVTQVIAVDQVDSDSTPNDNVGSDDDYASARVTPPIIDLSLTKSVAESRVPLGGEVSFTLTVRNDGPDDASGVSVRDELPTGLAYVSSSAEQGGYNSGTGIWEVGDLAAGEAVTLEIVASLTLFETLTNQAEVLAANEFDRDSQPGDGVEADDDFAAVDVSPASSDLSLTKTVDNAAPNVGGEVLYTITLANAGPDSAAEIQVQDQLPAELAFVDFTASVGDYDSATGVWQVPELANGANATLQIRATVQGNQAVSNSAEVIASNQFDPDSVPADNDPDQDDYAEVTLTPQLVDLALTKIVDEERPNVGDVIAYSLELSNAGPSTATGVEVTDLLPAGVTFESVQIGQGQYNAQTGIWTVGSVAANGTATLVISARVGEISGATNSAEVTKSDQPDIDSDPDNQDTTEDDWASVDFRTQAADLELQKSVDNATPDREAQVQFLLELTNSGPDTAEQIAVQDRLPADLRFESASASVGDYSAQTGMWTVASLASGETATLVITATVLTASPVVNTAEVTSVLQFDPDSTPGNGLVGEDDLGSVTITPPVVDLSVSAAVDNDSPLEGDVITMTFDVSNAGPIDATGVVVAVPFPDGMTLVSSDPGAGNYDPATGVWTVGDIAAGQTKQLVLMAQVDERGIKTIQVEVISADQFDIDSVPGNGVDSEDDQVELLIRAPRLLSKRLFMSRS